MDNNILRKLVGSPSRSQALLTLVLVSAAVFAVGVAVSSSEEMASTNAPNHAVTYVQQDIPGPVTYVPTVGESFSENNSSPQTVLPPHQIP